MALVTQALLWATERSQVVPVAQVRDNKGLIRLVAQRRQRREEWVGGEVGRREVKMYLCYRQKIRL